MANFLLEGPPCKFSEINVGIGEYFFEQTVKFGDKVLQIDGVTGKQETFNDVKRRSVRVAIYLQNIGVKPKGIVLVCCPNSLDNIIPALATIYLGAYVASVDPNKVVSEVKQTLLDLEPKVIFVVGNALELIEKSVAEANQKPHIITIGGCSDKYQNMRDIEANAQEREEGYRPVKMKGTDIVAIMFSSGTTSTPKGIYWTHWMLLNIAQCFFQQNNSKPGVLIHFSPFTWVSAWYITAMCFVTGSAKVICSFREAEQFFQIVEKYKVSYIICSSFHSYQITKLDKEVARKYDTSSLYSIFIGGSVVDRALLLKIRAYFPHTHVNLAYGSTEANCVSMHDYSNPEMSKEKVMSCGTLVAEAKMKIVDQESGKLLGPNQKGEIRVKSKYVMAGYHKLVKPDIFDEDGFFKIGDVGYYDNDGHIYVTDRITEMFKYLGYHVSPTLIEHALLQHSAVEEAIVFGLPHTAVQNYPAACVVLKPGAAATPEELLEFVKHRVSDYHQLRGGLVIVDSIPKNHVGKYQRRLAREIFMKLKQGI